MHEYRRHASDDEEGRDGPGGVQYPAADPLDENGINREDDPLRKRRETISRDKDFVKFFGEHFAIIS